MKTIIICGFMNNNRLVGYCSDCFYTPVWGQKLEMCFWITESVTVVTDRLHTASLRESLFQVFGKSWQNVSACLQLAKLDWRMTDSLDSSFSFCTLGSWTQTKIIRSKDDSLHLSEQKVKKGYNNNNNFNPNIPTLCHHHFKIMAKQ